MTSEQFKKRLSDMDQNIIEALDAIFNDREFTQWVAGKEAARVIGLDGWDMWQRQTREYGE
jgi:hypothetical protein